MFTSLIIERAGCRGLLEVHSPPAAAYPHPLLGVSADARLELLMQGVRRSLNVSDAIRRFRHGDATQADLKAHARQANDVHRQQGRSGCARRQRGKG